MGGEGTTTVIWTRNATFDPQDVQAVQRTPSGEWGSVQAVSKGPPGERQMTMDAGGNSVVAWTERDGLGSRVMVATN